MIRNAIMSSQPQTSTFTLMSTIRVSGVDFDVIIKRRLRSDMFLVKTW